jgi:hypothetical protein
MSLEQIAQKEKSYVVDYHCNSSNPVAARLFGWEHKSKLPENRQLDSHSDRYCPHPHRSERDGDHLNPLVTLVDPYWLVLRFDGISPKWRRKTLPG